MKKIALFLLGALALLPSYGQDTITESDTCYMFWPHSAPLNIYRNHYDMLAADTIVWENIVTEDTWIYGISVQGDWPLDSTVHAWLSKDLKDSTFNNSDTAYLDSSVVQNFFGCRVKAFGADTLSDYVAKYNELYFHRPWQMRDTFYVFIHFGRFDCEPYERTYTLYTWGDTIFPQRYCYRIINGVSQFMPSHEHPVEYIRGVWGNEFPILVPNKKHCSKPTGVRLAERGDGWVTVCWNGGSGDSYRVTVEGPDDTLVMETSDTAIRLDSLMPDANYWVQVQSLCRYQYYSFDSSFVNPGHTRMGFRTFSAGMTEPGDSPQITMHPNPASHAVEIVSSLPMTHIEVADVLGRVVGTYPQSNQNSFTLDISPLSHGTYLLRITTPAGSTTKKLLVQ